ncbi:MAG: preprotein translocase subunit YajC [Luteitalea sp.]|nr:preprotein translocase subunit YajC [Luteitalea sp.]
MMSTSSLVSTTVALASRPDAAVSPWVQLLPFAVILAIFYLLILLPMRRRQKKVADFQSNLKIGDKVVTTSGIYGAVTRLSDKTVRLQIADKVTVEIARAGIGGYQGQDPVVPESGSS